MLKKQIRSLSMNDRIKLKSTLNLTPKEEVLYDNIFIKNKRLGEIAYEFDREYYTVAHWSSFLNKKLQNI